MSHHVFWLFYVVARLNYFGAGVGDGYDYGVVAFAKYLSGAAGQHPKVGGVGVWNYTDGLAEGTGVVEAGYDFFNIFDVHGLDGVEDEGALIATRIDFLYYPANPNVLIIYRAIKITI